MISQSLNIEIWDRLIQGKPLDGLALGAKDGRIDVGGLELPEPAVLQSFLFEGMPMAEIKPGAIIRGARWQNLDFSGSKLKGLRLMDSELTRCRFDRCQLQGIRVWATNFNECTFMGANLRKSVLGGVQNGKWNRYSGVDFSGADLQETIYKATAFERCDFRHAKLKKIDFQSSTFVDCVFEGELRDVLFYRRGWEGETFPANEMVNVDFSSTKLHDIGFRGLVLDRVKLPSDAGHIVIKNVLPTLDRLTAALRLQGDPTAQKLTAFLNIDRKWAVPDLAQKVINIEDLAETVGEEGVIRLRELLRV